MTGPSNRLLTAGQFQLFNSPGAEELLAGLDLLIGLLGIALGLVWVGLGWRTPARSRFHHGGLLASLPVAVGLILVLEAVGRDNVPGWTVLASRSLAAVLCALAGLTLIRGLAGGGGNRESDGARPPAGNGTLPTHQDGEKSFRTLADSAPVMIWVAGPDGGRSYFSKRWLDFTGRTGDQESGDGWGEGVYPEDVDRCNEQIRSAVSAAAPFAVEYRLRRYDGAYRWVLDSGWPRTGPDGVIGYVGSAIDVTSYREGHAAAAEWQNRYSAAVLASGQMLFDWDPITNEMVYAGAVSRLLGYSAEELVGGLDQFIRLVHPDDRAAFLTEVDRVKVERDAFTLDFRLVHRDGRDVFVEARGHFIHDATGAVARMIGFLIDVTERRQAEEAVRASEARFRQLADAMPPIVWSARPDGTIDYLNERWYEFTGHTREAADGFNSETVLHPDDRERALTAWSVSVQTGLPYEIEYRLRDHRTGRYRWFLGRALPVRADDGTIERWFGTSTDIDDRKRLADAARSAAERFRALTESIPQLVWNASADGTVTYFNRRWQEYTGLTTGNALRDWWAQIVHPDDAGLLEASWVRLLADDPAPFNHEVRVRRQSDGEYRWHMTAVIPLRRPDGTVDQWIGSLSDIDDQKRQAEELERVVEARTLELRRSNEALEQFAYVASHDLQEPLRKIQAFGDRLRARSRHHLDDQARDYLDRTTAAATRMRQLIQDLLAYSRVTIQGRPFMPVALDSIIGAVLTDLEILVEQTGAAVEVGALPTVQGDPTQLRQLFQNLIANALKFHKPDVPPRIAIRSSHDAGAHRISVADNGIGFDEKYLDRIFQVFQRLHGRGEYEGTGVGLAICRKIVERHGGAITARSRPGEGSTFVVALPAYRPPPDATGD